MMQVEGNVLRPDECFVDLGNVDGENVELGDGRFSTMVEGRTDTKKIFWASIGWLFIDNRLCGF